MEFGNLWTTGKHTLKSIAIIYKNMSNYNVIILSKLKIKLPLIFYFCIYMSIYKILVSILKQYKLYFIYRKRTQ